MSLTYQYAHVQNHLSPKGKKVDAGSINTKSQLMQVNYAVTDQLTVSGSLPLVERKYNGNFPHRIADENGVVHTSKADDGFYHGSLQDLALGVQYQTTWDVWSIAPVASYSRPIHDYQHFAHSAIGANQKKLTVGVVVARGLPVPLERSYVQVATDYSWYEQYRGISVGRATLNIETGFAATERLQVRIFTIGQKSFGGLEFPTDFLPFNKNARLFYHHDQVQRVDYVDAGCGVTYALSAQTDLIGQYLTTLWGENGHETDFQLSIGISRTF